MSRARTVDSIKILIKTDLDDPSASEWTKNIIYNEILSLANCSSPGRDDSRLLESMRSTLILLRRRHRSSIGVYEVNAYIIISSQQ